MRDKTRRRRGRRTRHPHAGIVDEHIQPAEVGDDGVYDRLELALVGDVELIGARLSASGGDLVDDLVELVLAASGNGDERPPRREMPGGFRAEPGAATGDQYDFAFNCFVHDTSPKKLAWVASAGQSIAIGSRTPAIRSASALIFAE